MEIQKGSIVKSVAGHDKDRFYLIVKIEGKRAYIADGKRRKIGCPKPKNFLHIKGTNKLVNLADYKTDKSLRLLLHSYNYKDQEKLED